VSFPPTRRPRRGTFGASSRPTALEGPPAKAGELIRRAQSLVVRVVGRFAGNLVRLAGIRRLLWQQTPAWQAAAG